MTKKLVMVHQEIYPMAKATLPEEMLQALGERSVDKWDGKGDWLSAYIGGTIMIITGRFKDGMAQIIFHKDELDKLPEAARTFVANMKAKKGWKSGRVWLEVKPKTNDLPYNVYLSPQVDEAIGNDTICELIKLKLDLLSQISFDQIRLDDWHTDTTFVFKSLHIGELDGHKLILIPCIDRDGQKSILAATDEKLSSLAKWEARKETKDGQHRVNLFRPSNN